MTAASSARVAITDMWRLLGSGPLRSVLICDDRPSVLHRLSTMLRSLPDLDDISWVPDGFALLDAVTARPVDLVLIGIHRATQTGAEATILLAGINPGAIIIVFGAATDIDVLAAAYLRGAHGLLPWNPYQPDPAPGPQPRRSPR